MQYFSSGLLNLRSVRVTDVSDLPDARILRGCPLRRSADTDLRRRSAWLEST